MCVRFGIIGIGRMGYTHARIISQYLPGTQLVAIADMNGELAQRGAAQLGVPYWFEHYKDLLHNSELALDALVIATPSYTHAKIVQDSVALGIPIFCEKLLALTIEETDSTLKAVDVARIPLQIGFHYRSHPSYIQARTLLASGAIGKPMVFKALQRDAAIPSAQFCRPDVSGGIIIDMGIHEFDVACWFFQDEIVEVTALAPQPSDATALLAGDLDHALITIRLRCGVVGNIELSRNAYYPDESRHDLLGSKGTILLGQMPQSSLLLATEKQVQGVMQQDIVQPIYQAYYQELASFVETVTTGSPPHADGNCSRAALRVALAAYDSLRSGKPVRLSWE